MRCMLQQRLGRALAGQPPNLYSLACFDSSQLTVPYDRSKIATSYDKNSPPWNKRATRAGITFAYSMSRWELH